MEKKKKKLVQTKHLLILGLGFRAVVKHTVLRCTGS